MHEYKIDFSQMPLEEQETSINIDYVDKKAYIYTSKASVARNLLDMVTANSEEAAVTLCNSGGFEVSVPSNWIMIRPKIKREYTEEQRQALAERLAAARSKRKENKQ